MDTSVTLIGLAIIVLMVVPLYKVYRSAAQYKAKINAILSQYPESSFGQIESQNKKTYALDQKNKHFVFADFNFSPEREHSIDLKQVSSCKVIPVTQGISNEIVSIELEFQYKNSSKEIVAVYNAEHDTITQVCLHEDHELAKKWQQQINVCLSS